MLPRPRIQQQVSDLRGRKRRLPLQALIGRYPALGRGYEIDKGEDDILDSSAVTVTHYETLRDAGVKSALAAPLDGLSSRVRDIYLHVDIDVLAPEVTVANQFQPPGGLGIEALIDALTMVGDRFQIRGATLASYDADADREGKGIGVGMHVLENIADIGWGP